VPYRLDQTQPNKDQIEESRESGAPTANIAVLAHHLAPNGIKVTLAHYKRIAFLVRAHVDAWPQHADQLAQRWFRDHYPKLADKFWEKLDEKLVEIRKLSAADANE
jgi:hypothetical protein